jgi:hypothetical protein
MKDFPQRSRWHWHFDFFLCLRLTVTFDVSRWVLSVADSPYMADNCARQDIYADRKNLLSWSWSAAVYINRVHGFCCVRTLMPFTQSRWASSWTMSTVKVNEMRNDFYTRCQCLHFNRQRAKVYCKIHKNIGGIKKIYIYCRAFCFSFLQKCQSTPSIVFFSEI